MRARPFVSSLAVVLASLAVRSPARAETDTQFIFGWTQGADVGEAGERELESENNLFHGKRGGRYSLLQSDLRFEATPVENLRLEIGAPLVRYDIAGVPGLADRSSWRIGGVSGAVRYKLLSREHAPLALTVGIEPRWSVVDEASGERSQGYGAEISLAVDKELIDEQLFIAGNLSFDPEMSRDAGDAAWRRQSTFTAAVSLTRQWRKGFFAGAELRYLRAQDSAGLRRFAGEGLFIGPTVYLQLSKAAAISGAWSVQAAGREHGATGALDLADFHRHQATLRLEYTF